jgi:hypothetical protein
MGGAVGQVTALTMPPFHTSLLMKLKADHDELLTFTDGIDPSVAASTMLCIEPLEVVLKVWTAFICLSLCGRLLKTHSSEWPRLPLPVHCHMVNAAARVLLSTSKLQVQHHSRKNSWFVSALPCRVCRPLKQSSSRRHDQAAEPSCVATWLCPSSARRGCCCCTMACGAATCT